MNKTQSTAQQSTSHVSSQPTYRLTTSTHVLDVSINYHVGVLDGGIQYWAGVAGVTVAELKEATEATVRSCHHAAVLETKGDSRHPDVYELGIGQLKVIVVAQIRQKQIYNLSGSRPLPKSGNANRNLLFSFAPGFNFCHFDRS